MQFENILGLRSNISESTKFTYLSMYLMEYAQKVMYNLRVTYSNFDVALKLLEKKFLEVLSWTCLNSFFL